MVQSTLLTLLFFGVALTSASVTKRRHESYDVVNKILDSDEYNKYEAPGEADGQSTTVGVGIYVIWLSIDQSTNTADVVFYFRQRWNDGRLAFEGNHASVRLFEREKLWLPDSFFRSVVEPVQSDYYLLKVNKNGDVWYAQRMFAKFPFIFSGRNTHTPDGFFFSLIVESFGYTSSTMSFTSMQSPLELDADIGLSGFTVTNSTTYDCSTTYTSGTYPCHDFVIQFAKDNTQN